MPLSQAADQRLAELGVELVVEGRVLFVELVQAGRQLVLLPPLLHLHGHRDDRLGEGDLGQDQRVLPRGQGVVGMRVAELGHDADVPGAQLGDLGALLPHRHAQVVQLLHGLAGRVPDVLAVPHGAGEHPEVGDVPHVGLGDGLEHLGRERAAVRGTQGDPLGAAPLLRLERGPVGR